MNYWTRRPNTSALPDKSQTSDQIGTNTDDDGIIPGYAIFNLKTRYEVFDGFSLFTLVKDLFDRRYATAGRLGINPFSSSQKGAIDPSVWQNSTFIDSGTPRAIWLGFDYKFDK